MGAQNAVLEEIEKHNKLKIKKAKNENENESGILRKLQSTLKREQKDLNELKIKFQRIHNEYINFALDHDRRKNFCDELKEQNAKDEAELADLDKEIKENQIKTDDYI